MSNVSPLSGISGLSFDSTLPSPLLSFCLVLLLFLSCLFLPTPQWGAVDAEIKVPSGENTELKRSPLKPGSGQYIAIHATLTARDFFLAYFYPSGPFICILSKPSPNFFVPVQARRIKQVTLLDAGSHVECPRNINRLKKIFKKKHDLWYDDL